MSKVKNYHSVVFVALTGDEEIKLYDLNPNSGSLQLRTISNAHGPVGALHLHPSRNFMLAAHVESTTLASFRLDRNSGTLTLINKIDVGISIPAHLITDRSGRFLITAYYGGGGITVHRLNSDGSIGILLQHLDTNEKAHCVFMTESDRFVFVPHVCPTNKTFQFRFDSETGHLSPNRPAALSPPNNKTGPRHLCFRPKGDIAYIVNEQGNTITTHRFDPECGTLEILQNISTLPSNYTKGGNTAHVEIHPNGKWAYASNRGHDSIVGFKIDPEGLLDTLGYYSVPSNPRSFNIDPTGRFLYCAGESANTMTAYQVDQKTGILQPIADYDVGHKPFWVMATSLV